MAFLQKKRHELVVPFLNKVLFFYWTISFFVKMPLGMISLTK